MTYTKTKPSAPGWYWVRREDYTYRNIHLISRGDSGGLFLVHQSPVTKMVPLEEVDRLEFAGPIPEPVEELSEAEANRLIEELKRAVTDKDFAEQFIKARVGDVVDGVVSKYTAALFAEAAKRVKQ